jgi:K(+)-stimulated pyrophosphate-energized sodium pump
MTGFIAAEGGRINATFRPLENNALWVILGVAVIALVVAYLLVKQVLAAPEGSPKMIEIAKAIQEGAEAYLSRQFKTVGLFVALLGVILFWIVDRIERLVIPWHVSQRDDIIFAS